MKAGCLPKGKQRHHRMYFISPEVAGLRGLRQTQASKNRNFDNGNERMPWQKFRALFTFLISAVHGGVR